MNCILSANLILYLRYLPDSSLVPCFLAEFSFKPDFCNFLCLILVQNPGSKAQHIAVVMLPAHLGSVFIEAICSSYPLYLVCNYRFSNSSSAHQDSHSFVLYCFLCDFKCCCRVVIAVAIVIDS